MAADAQIESAAELFRVLAHENRLRLLRLLAAGEKSVSAIDTATGIGQPGLSQQLAILRKAGLVATRRAAKQIYYRADPMALQGAAAFLEQLVDKGSTATTVVAGPIGKSGSRPLTEAAGFARMV